MLWCGALLQALGSSTVPVCVDTGSALQLKPTFSLLRCPCRYVQVLEGLPEDTPEAPEVPTVKGNELRGGPQMLQLRWAPQLARASPQPRCSML